MINQLNPIGPKSPDPLTRIKPYKQGAPVKMAHLQMVMDKLNEVITLVNGSAALIQAPSVGVDATQGPVDITVTGMTVGSQVVTVFDVTDGIFITDKYAPTCALVDKLSQLTNDYTAKVLVVTYIKA